MYARSFWFDHGFRTSPVPKLTVSETLSLTVRCHTYCKKEPLCRWRRTLYHHIRRVRMHGTWTTMMCQWSKRCILCTDHHRSQFEDCNLKSRHECSSYHNHVSPNQVCETPVSHGNHLVLRSPSSNPKSLDRRPDNMDLKSCLSTSNFWKMDNLETETKLFIQFYFMWFVKQVYLQHWWFWFVVVVVLFFACEYTECVRSCVKTYEVNKWQLPTSQQS